MSDFEDFDPKKSRRKRLEFAKKLKNFRSVKIPDLRKSEERKRLRIKPKDISDDYEID